MENIFTVKNYYKYTDKLYEPKIVLYKNSICDIVIYLQCSVKLNENAFITVKFVLDTKLDKHLLIGYNLWKIFEDEERLILEDDNYFINIEIGGKNIKCCIELSNEVDKTVLGLPFFFLLGINFSEKTNNELEFINSICYNNGITYSWFNHL